MGEKWTDFDGNARNLDGTPYLGHHGGTGQDANHPRVQGSRERNEQMDAVADSLAAAGARALGLGANRTPAQRKADARAATQAMDADPVAAMQDMHDDLALHGAQIDLLCKGYEQTVKTHETANVLFHRLTSKIIEQGVRIDGLETRINDQNAWNGNQTREISRLAERMAKAERQLAAQDRELRSHMSALLRAFQPGIADVTRHLDEFDAFKARVIEAFPIVGKQTIQQQSAESWTQPKEEDN